MNPRIRVIKAAMFWNDVDESCIFWNSKTPEHQKAFDMIVGLFKEREMNIYWSIEKIANYFDINREVIEKSYDRHLVHYTHTKQYRETYLSAFNSVKQKQLVK